MLVIIILSSVRTNIVYKQTIVFFHVIYHLFSRNNRNFFTQKFKEETVNFFHGEGRQYFTRQNINMERLTDIHNNILKFCGDHILNNFFFGCIIDMKKKIKKKRREPASLNAFFRCGGDYLTLFKALRY